MFLDQLGGDIAHPAALGHLPGELRLVVGPHRAQHGRGLRFAEHGEGFEAGGAEDIGDFGPAVGAYDDSVAAFEGDGGLGGSEGPHGPPADDP